MHVWGDCPREKWVIPFFMPISDVLTRLYKLRILSSLPHDFLSATPRPFLSYSKPVSPLFAQNVREKRRNCKKKVKIFAYVQKMS